MTNDPTNDLRGGEWTNDLRGGERRWRGTNDLRGGERGLTNVTSDPT